ncbi:MAG: hypothetical protein M1826_005610 [Phylliscum demangeonii]|nr:MAG: hypothetical protein M1826_005610 [Phylliscum demangeonii]
MQNAFDGPLDQGYGCLSHLYPVLDAREDNRSDAAFPNPPPGIAAGHPVSGSSLAKPNRDPVAISPTDGLQLALAIGVDLFALKEHGTFSWKWQTDLNPGSSWAREDAPLPLMADWIEAAIYQKSGISRDLSVEHLTMWRDHVEGRSYTDVVRILIEARNAYRETLRRPCARIAREEARMAVRVIQDCIDRLTEAKWASIAERWAVHSSRS